jgi:hypothetical protein
VHRAHARTCTPDTGRTFEVDHNYCRAVRVGEGDVIYVAGTTSLIPGEIVQHPGEVGH